MSTNRRIHARNVRFYMLILNVAFMLILSDREQDAGATGDDVGVSRPVGQAPARCARRSATSPARRLRPQRRLLPRGTRHAAPPRLRPTRRTARHRALWLRSGRGGPGAATGREHRPRPAPCRARPLRLRRSRPAPRPCRNTGHRTAPRPQATPGRHRRRPLRSRSSRTRDVLHPPTPVRLPRDQHPPGRRTIRHGRPGKQETGSTCIRNEPATPCDDPASSAVLHGIQTPGSERHAGRRAQIARICAHYHQCRHAPSAAHSSGYTRGLPR